MLSDSKCAEHTVVTAIEQQAALRAACPALIGDDRTLNFDEMNRAANRVAHALRAALGNAAGFVAVCLPPSVDRIVAVIGILKSGLGYVVIDPRLHEQGRRDLVEHAGVLLVVTNQTLAGTLGAELQTLDIKETSISGPTGNPGIYPAPDAPAYLRYTSGSTGDPKGVLHNHRAALGQGCAFVETVSLRPDDRLCCVTFFPHALYLGTLAAGGALHIVDPTRDGLRVMANRLRRDRVTLLSCFPSMLRSLSVALLAGGRLADLRAITFSGEPVAASDVNLALRCMSEDGIAINNYGSSEFVQIASHSIRGELPDGAVVPVGRPVSGAEIRLLDAEGNAVPDGESGEVTVRAPFMSSGYWKRPDLTQAVFGSATPQDGQAAYRTGDIGRIDSAGLLSLLGRVDNQIKLRAYRITPEEIENVLRQHAVVTAVAVRAFEDEQGTPLLAAYVVSAPGSAMESETLRGFAQMHLPPYMVPSVFLPIAALPQTVGGKLNRAALPDPLPLWRASHRDDGS